MREAIKGIAFIEGDKMGAEYGVTRTQFNRAPPAIAPRVRNKTGRVRVKVSSDD